MGNQLCQAVAKDSQFKIDCQQECNGKSALKQNIKPKLQPITFSQKGTPRKYLESPNNKQLSELSNNQQHSEQKLQLISKQQFIPRVNNFDDYVKETNLKGQNNTKKDRKDNFFQKTVQGSKTEKNNDINSNFIYNQNNSPSKVQQKPQSTQFDLSSPTKQVKLDYNHLYLKHVNSNIQQGNTKYVPISAPFSIIKLMMNQQLKQFINHDDPTFFKKYDNDKQSFKLFKGGFYGNILTDDYGIFINKNYIYYGNFTYKNAKQAKEKQQYIPDKRGYFLSLKGKYVGEFKNGKPNGRGKFYQFSKAKENEGSQNLLSNTYNNQFQASNTSFNFNHTASQLLKIPQKKLVHQTFYQGVWEDGLLKQGIIQNSHLKYQGAIQNRQPNGYGQLFLKDTHSKYQGMFKQGKFHGQNGIYESKLYNYAGQFKNGKKNGYGVYIKNSTHFSNTGEKYKFDQKLEGMWQNDTYKPKFTNRSK